MERALKNNEKIYRISLAEEKASEIIALMNNESITYELQKEEDFIITIIADDISRRKINHQLKEMGETTFLKYDKRLKVKYNINNLIDEMNIIEKYDYPNDEFEYTEEQKYITQLNERIYELEYKVETLMNKIFPPKIITNKNDDDKLKIEPINKKVKFRLKGW